MQTAAEQPGIARAAGLSARVCRALALALIACFLASIARFYHPGTGFTSLIGFAQAHEDELPAMAGVPHVHVPTGGYDGQFYAQLALVPLLKDPAIDRALDNPPYRARRILFSWTAYLAALGRPAWTIQIYAIQNIICWLVLSWVLTWWMRPDTPRGLALWAACLFSQGLLISVRLALTDGPSLLLLALAAAAAERGRLWTTSVVLGLAGLARETNLFGLTMLRVPRRRVEWLRMAAAIVLAVAPLLLWQDYLWSIYRTATFSDQDLLSAPFTGFLRKWDLSLRGVMRDGLGTPHMWSLVATAGLAIQALFLVSCGAFRSVWWRLAAPFVVLMWFLDWVAWGGFPGAATRVLLPMTVGFNIVLQSHRSRVFWIWYALGNISLVYAPLVLR
jgi:hypothetical protein